MMNGKIYVQNDDRGGFLAVGQPVVQRPGQLHESQCQQPGDDEPACPGLR